MSTLLIVVLESLLVLLFTESLDIIILSYLSFAGSKDWTNILLLVSFLSLGAASSNSISLDFFIFLTGVEAVMPLLAISISVSSSIEVLIVVIESLLELKLSSLIPSSLSDSGSAS